MRETSYIPETPKPILMPYVTYKCDGCGKNMDRAPMTESFAHELEICLDAEECVSFYRRRDYCPECLEPIWQAVNKLIGADPDLPGSDPEE
jgi:hypothetical protein